MAQEITIPTGAPTFNIEEIVIGSQFNFAVRFRRRISQDPDVFEDFDFTGMTLKADVKDKLKTDVEADFEMTCTPRTPGDGWVDFFMSGEVTGDALQKAYFSSFKVWPDGSPELGDTLCKFVLPFVYAATR